MFFCSNKSAQRGKKNVKQYSMYEHIFFYLKLNKKNSFFPKNVLFSLISVDLCVRTTSLYEVIKSCVLVLCYTSVYFPQIQQQQQDPHSHERWLGDFPPAAALLEKLTDDAIA